jgi:flagella basal body P-ring formation protein FlgA
VSSPAHPTGTITLRPAARVEPGAPVLLSDIAALDGPAAEALAAVTVAPAATTDWQSLDAAAIRAAIDTQADPVWGHLALVGAQCRVRALGAAANAAAEIDPQSAAAPTPTDPTTVRAVIESRLAAALACTPADLRLEFSERDHELIAQTALGRTVDVQPTGFSERLPLRLTIFQGEQLLTSTSIRVGVLVRRQVAVTPAALPRGHVIAASDLIPDTRWLPPDIRPVAIDDAPGLVLRTRLTPGASIASTDVETPILVRRGQQLTVHSVDGAVSLQVRARAMEEGREGDTIRCESIAPPQARSARAQRAPRRESREFLARVIGPGLAVAVQDGDAAIAGASIASDSPALTLPAQSPATLSDPATGITITPIGPQP